MQKVSHLPVTMLNFRLILFIFIMFFSIQCGTLKTPRYSGSNYKPQSEVEDMTSPNEIYKSEQVLKNPKHNERSTTFSLQWPVRKLKINRGYMPNKHYGVDIGGMRGDSILAAHDGVVVYAGSGFKGYGRMIILEYNSTWATLYAHMNKLKVKTGDEVRAGKIIGNMGSSGRTTGVHLHFELIKNKQPIDPQPELIKSQSIAWLN